VPPQYTDHADQVIEKGTSLRLKILGVKPDVAAINAIGTIKEDYLGSVPLRRMCQSLLTLLFIADLFNPLLAIYDDYDYENEIYREGALNFRAAAHHSTYQTARIVLMLFAALEFRLPGMIRGRRSASVPPFRGSRNGQRPLIATQAILFVNSPTCLRTPREEKPALIRKQCHIEGNILIYTQPCDRNQRI
jgi:hypothetical protein